MSSGSGGATDAEVLIVGGGLAGSAAAILLARAGRNVVLLEKDSQAQHKVCGEFLSQEALTYLAALGVDAAALGAVPIAAVRLAGSRGATCAALPFAAMSLTRKRLDEELLQAAAAAGAQVLRGCRVQTVQAAGPAAGPGWCACVQGQAETVSAAAAFLASGKHDVHGRARPPGRQRGLVAFKMYWKLAPQQAAKLAGHVELMMFPGGYAGLQPVEGGAANLCCLIQRSELQRAAVRSQRPGQDGRPPGQAARRPESHWEALFGLMQQACPQLRERLAGATPLLQRPLAAAGLPYGYVRSASDGVWALGDQAAVIPSFTGDGMSIALHSGCLAAAMYLRGATAASFQQQLHSELNRQVRLATLLSRGLVRAPLQSLFAALVSAWPGSLGVAAQRTRIAPAALLAHSAAALPERGTVQRAAV